MMFDRLLRVSVAAKRIDVSTRTVHRYIASGSLPATKLLPSGHWRIAESALHLLLDRERARFTSHITATNPDTDSTGE